MVATSASLANPNVVPASLKICVNLKKKRPINPYLFAIASAQLTNTI